MATWDRVLLQVWSREAPLEAIQGLKRVASDFIASTPKKISSLAIIERTATPPSDVARTALSKFYREFAPQMNAAIVVAEGGGFRAAFVRGVGVTLSTLAPRALPFKFVGTIEEAATLVTPHLSPVAGGNEALLNQIEELRRQLPELLASASTMFSKPPSRPPPGA